MLAVQVTRSGWDGPRRYTFPAGRVALIKGAGPDVSLSESTDGRVVALVWCAGRRLRVDPRGAGSAFVNDQRLTGQQVLAPGDELRVGLFRYRFAFTARPAEVDTTAYAPTEPAEQDLLAALAHDPTARVVYADWLEQRGDPTRAALLRVQAALTEAPPDEVGELRARLAALAAEVPAGWRALVTDPAIEACGVQFKLRCPQQWANLAPTARADVRHCATCDRDVHYTISVGAARSHARLGRCIALDVTAARWPRDLDPPYGLRCVACRADRSLDYPGDACDHCGHVEERPMLLGKV